MKVILGLDAGTHGVRALAFDPVLQTLIGSAGHDYARSCTAGIQEMDAAALTDAMEQALAALLEVLPAGTQVEALGVTHQRGTVIPVDREARVLGPALCDSDSRAATGEELETLGLSPEAYYCRTGCPFVSFNGMAKILWAKFHERSLYDRAAAWLSPQDYLISRLTGKLVVTEGSSSRNGCLSIRERTPARDLFPDAAFLQRDCTAVGESCGTVCANWADRFPALGGAKIIAVPGDQPAAVIGSGAAADGGLAMNLGTTFVASLCGAAPQFDPEGLTTIEVLPQGGYAMEFGTGAGGQFMDWLANMMLDGETADASFWQTLNDRTAQAPAGAEGLRILPLLWQVTSPGVSGGIYHLGMHHTRAHLARAAYEGLACEARLSIQRVERVTGRCPETLHVFGGMSDSTAFLRILSSLTGKRVLAAGEKQASAFGAALTAALRCGYYQTLAEASAAADRHTRQYLPEKEEQYDGFFEAYCARR